MSTIVMVPKCRCPRCEAGVRLLSPTLYELTVLKQPSFYLCTCGWVGQVGVGEVLTTVAEPSPSAVNLYVRITNSVTPDDEAAVMRLVFSGIPRTVTSAELIKNGVYAMEADTFLGMDVGTLSLWTRYDSASRSVMDSHEVSASPLGPWQTFVMPIGIHQLLTAAELEVLMSNKAVAVAAAAETPEKALFELPPYTVVNPGGKVIAEKDLPSYIGLFTNSDGYCASLAVLEEARHRGIECIERDLAHQALSICRVDASCPPSPDFDDIDAVAELVSKGYMVVTLPDFLSKLAGQPDGGAVNGVPTLYELLPNGRAPSRFYAVSKYTPPAVEVSLPECSLCDEKHGRATPKSTELGEHILPVDEGAGQSGSFDD